MRGSFCQSRQNMETDWKAGEEWRRHILVLKGTPGASYTVCLPCSLSCLSLSLPLSSSNMHSVVLFHNGPPGAPAEAFHQGYSYRLSSLLTVGLSIIASFTLSSYETAMVCRVGASTIPALNGYFIARENRYSRISGSPPQPRYYTLQGLCKESERYDQPHQLP